MEPELRACLKDLSNLLCKLTTYLEKQAQPDDKASLADRIDAALKTITRVAVAFVSATAAVILLIMSFNAFRSESVIVEAYNVPKILADRGLTGQVVAETVLDALNHTQVATRLAGGKLRLTEAWNEPLKLEIPKTGMSLGELRDLLHSLLGGDIHVTGELTQLPGADFALTVRGDGIPARRFVFQEPDFISTTTKAAEYIYGTAEPVAFATYLLQQFRLKDGLQFLDRTYAFAPAKVRPQLATLWAKLNAYSGNFERAVELDSLALKLDPFNWPAWEELAQDKRLLEGPESQLATFREMHKAASRAPFTLQPRLIDFRLEYNLLHDAPGEINALIQDSSQVASGTEGTSAWYGLAMAELGRHGYKSAHHYFDEADPDDPQLEGHLHDVQSGFHPATDQAAILREREAADRANWANEA